MSLKYKFYLLLFLAGGFFMVCSQQDIPDNEKYLLQKKNPIGKYGKKIELSAITTIQDLLNSPNEYVDKEVLIEGKIDEVCSMRGCWINILDPETNENIRLKVKDGAIVFPPSPQHLLAKALQYPQYT